MKNNWEGAVSAAEKMVQSLPSDSLARQQLFSLLPQARIFAANERVRVRREGAGIAFDPAADNVERQRSRMVGRSKYP